MNSTVVCRWPGRAIRSSRGRWPWFFWVWMMLAVWSSLHISKNPEQKWCGRGGMREGFMQHPLVSPSRDVDVRMVSGLHNVTVESKASKTFNYLRSNINTSSKQNPTPFDKLFYNLFNFLRIWPWDFPHQLWCLKMQRNCQQQWGGVTTRTLAALVGGFGRAKPKQQHCSSSSASAP